MELIKKLNDIQQTLKAPKNQYNSFGKYSYRSAEDILEAVKPLLNGAVVILSDKPENIGNKNYIVATATIMEGDEKIEVTGTAREAETQKGMNDAQISGSSSSYARKYAMNGLFAIDDTKDADDESQHPNKGSNLPQNATLQPQTTQDAINRAKNYKKPLEDDNKPWLTNELFTEAIKNFVKAGAVKIGTEPQKVMKVLRDKYNVERKYEEMIPAEIDKHAIGVEV